MVEITDYTEEITAQIVKFLPPSQLPGRNETTATGNATSASNGSSNANTTSSSNGDEKGATGKNMTNSDGGENSSEPVPIRNDTTNGLNTTSFFVKNLARSDTDE